MPTRTKKVRDPKSEGPRPPFPDQEQSPPGLEGEMEPLADHGEKTYRGHERLKGFATLITGGDSGIGRAVALAFAREGADVLVSYLSEERDAEQTAHLVEEAGRKVICIRGDIQEQSHCRELVAEAVDKFGKLDCLVNNAAYQMAIDDLDGYTPEQLERTFRTNIFSMFHLCQAAVPHMRAGASIINVTSIQGYDPSPNLLDYAATKAAITNFTKSLAKKLMPQGIRVNAVAPGPVWTPLIPSTMPQEKVQNFGDNTLYERPAQPGELAPVFVLLASPEASYITGEVYGVTGGRTPY
jgi:NAD(P)-dependent dehydrogenase (short-subunit alcohol dehydrogenase family)